MPGRVEEVYLDKFTCNECGKPASVQGAYPSEVSLVCEDGHVQSICGKQISYVGRLCPNCETAILGNFCPKCGFDKEKVADKRVYRICERPPQAGDYRCEKHDESIRKKLTSADEKMLVSLISEYHDRIQQMPSYQGIAARMDAILKEHATSSGRTVRQALKGLRDNLLSVKRSSGDLQQMVKLMQQLAKMRQAMSPDEASMIRLRAWRDYKKACVVITDVSAQIMNIVSQVDVDDRTMRQIAQQCKRLTDVASRDAYESLDKRRERPRRK